MRVLVIKTSSLGDVVHALPALTDAVTAIPGISFDWVVEEAFAPIPSWHSAVIEVIPVALRRWRKSPFSKQTRQQWHEFKHRIQVTDYDMVIDAQGLFKSAWLTRKANGTSHGFDRHSAREGLVAFIYDNSHHVDRDCQKAHLITESLQASRIRTPASWSFFMAQHGKVSTGQSSTGCRW
jgi:heptosyltransferase-1